MQVEGEIVLDMVSSMGRMIPVPRIKPLSDQLRDAVLGCGYTRYELSQRLGIDQSALSKFVRGQRGLSWACVDRLAEFLELRLVCARARRPGGGDR